MNYSDFKKHILDKNCYFFYIIIFVVFLIFAYLTYIHQVEFQFSRYWGFVFAIPLFFIFSIRNILLNMSRCRNFYNSFKNELSLGTAILCKIYVETKNYRMVGVNHNFDAEISSKPKLVNAICIETDEYLLFFFSMGYFGLFKEVLKPFVFIKSGNKHFLQDIKSAVIYDYNIDETENGKAVAIKNIKSSVSKILVPKFSVQITP